VPAIVPELKTVPLPPAITMPTGAEIAPAFVMEPPLVRTMPTPAGPLVSIVPKLETVPAAPVT
jgi:hypothetical protein